MSTDITHLSQHNSTDNKSFDVNRHLYSLEKIFSLNNHSEALLPIICDSSPYKPRQIANGAPIGLLGFAIVSILAAIPKLENRQSEDALLFVVAFFIGGAAQIFASLIQYLNNHLHGATTFMLFGLHWTAQAIRLFTKHSTSLDFQPHPASIDAAIYYLLLTIGSIILWIPSFRMNLTLNVTLFFVIFAFGFDIPAAYGARWGEVGSAIAAIMASILAIYMALTDIVNEQWHDDLLTLVSLDSKKPKDQQENFENTPRIFALTKHSSTDSDLDEIPV